MPEPGILLLKSDNTFGKYCEGIRLFSVSKKNLISTTLSPNGIQKAIQRQNNFLGFLTLVSTNFKKHYFSTGASASSSLSVRIS